MGATGPSPSIRAETEGRAPRRVRALITTAVLTLIAGALWLIAVRGEAMLIDLYASAAAFLCL